MNSRFSEQIKDNIDLGKTGQVKSVTADIRKALFEMQDREYRDFHSRLMPNIEKDRIIGVRTPILRKYAKSLADSVERQSFIADLPHFYYEENNLHAFFIEQERNFESSIAKIDEFLPYVDNWATCDMMSPKALAKNKPALYEKILLWIASDSEYTVRYGLKELMTHFLDKDFKPEYLEVAASVKLDKYYVKMMVAWFFATVLTKQYETALPYIENKKLSVWCHNKAISKACDSLRIDRVKKEYLKTLRINTKN